MTKTLYAATSAYVGEINKLPVKRQVSVSGILKKLDVSRSGYNAWKKRVPFIISYPPYLSVFSKWLVSCFPY